ncbi:hypothetical protein BH09PSE6_BH09PSE6_19120 [soil metagenome]
MQRNTAPSATATDASLLIDLLAVGAIVCRNRVITSANRAFADLFGYWSEGLRGVSLERLYPSRREFIDRGDEWRSFMSLRNEHCDERVMLTRDGQPIWVRVRGRCSDTRDPYRLIACTFELAPQDARQQVALSPRERDIVECMGEGLTSKQIAQRLHLSHRTVETYRSRMMTRTGARNANQLIKMLIA